VSARVLDPISIDPKSQFSIHAHIEHTKGKSIMGALQPMHLIVVLVIILLIFGPGKLPELGRAVGDGMRELKRATSGEADTTPSRLQPKAATTATGAVCLECQAPLPTDSRFCGVCGAQTGAAPRAHALV
jgi:sec-independent protein translocase protein TatA